MQVFPPLLQKIMFSLVFVLSVTAVVTIFYTLFINVNQTPTNQYLIADIPTVSPTYPPMIFPTETTAPTPDIEPTNTIDPTNTPMLVSIPRISTVGWKSVSNNGVNFLIPPDARCSGTDDACIGVVTSFIYEGKTIESNMIIAVEPYRGGSRRTQYIEDHEQSLVDSCNPIFVESLFGSVNALQIASTYDCYGAGGIVTVVGDKLVTFYALSYDPQTNEIERSPIRDTIISTVTN